MVVKNAIAIRYTFGKERGHMKCGILSSVSCFGYCTPAVSCEVMESTGDSELEPLPKIGEFILKTDADVEPLIETISSDLPSISELVGEIKCKPCVVILRRLSPDEIELHTTKLLSSHADSLELEPLSSSYRLEKKTIQKQKLFEKYKLSRQSFQKRKRFSHYHGTDEISSETKFEDENPGHPKKRKGRNRKHLAYEDDVEWSPDGSKHMYVPNYKTKVNKATKMLRQNARRKIIDSASSDSEDESQYGYYWEDFGQNQEESTTSKNVFPSQEAVVSANLLPDKVERTEGNPESYDVLSKIMQDMDNQSSRMAKRKFDGNKKINSFTNRSLSPQKRLKRKRKISVMGGKFVRSDSNSSTVSGVMQDIVSLVCSAADTGGKETVSNITKKVCHSCGTPFSNSQVAEELCVICKVFEQRDSKKRVRRMASKQNKLNKGVPKSPKNKSKVKNRLLKVVPKGDMQRLLYADKSSEKGYNHCKTINLSVQKNEKILDTLNKSSDHSLSSNIVLNKGNGPRVKKNAAKSKNLQVNKKSNQVINKKTKCALKETESNSVKCSSAVNSDSKFEANLSQNHVSVTNVGKGLFLMTFPEPDKELDLKGNLPKLSSKKENEAMTKVTAAESLSFSASVMDTTGKSVSDSGKYGSYVMPTVPGVVITNYATDDKKGGEYRLSSVFCRNDSTAPPRPQLVQKPVQISVAANRPQLSITPILPILTKSSSPLTPSRLPNLLTTSSYMPTSVRPTNVLIHQPATNITLCAPSGPLIINKKNALCRVTNTNACLPNTLTSNIRVQNNVPQITLIGNPYPDFSLNCNNESQLKITNVETVRTANKIQNNHFNSSEMYLSAETGEFVLKNNTALSITSHLSSETAAQDNSTLEKAPVKELAELKLNAKDTSVKCQTGTVNASQISENAPKVSQLNAAYVEIEAIGVLAILDLDKNPSFELNVRFEVAKNELQKPRSSSSEKVNVEFHYLVLETAQKWMRQYGSFKRVSDHLLGKDNLIKIKKEILEEEEEPEDGRSSCAFSKSPASFSSPTDNTLHAVPQNSYNNPSSAAGPLARLETQIASINHPLPPEFEPSSILHHYPSAGLVGGGGASALMTPRIDFDSRMTPSRGSSGLQTPARPESATSQTEELTATQIKQERFENATSPSHCAFPQSNTPVSSQTIATQIANPLNAIASVANMPIMSNSVVAQPVNQQAIHHYRVRDIPPNRTAPFDPSQNLARALLTMNPRPHNSNVLSVQQVYLPGNAGFPRAPAPVPSTLSSNNFVLRQNASVNVTSGQIVVNNAQMTSQAVYPVLSNAANQQVYNTNQQTYSSNQQVYYAPQVSSSLVPSPSSYVVPNKPVSMDVDQMFCAVCNKVATLRCKQCAKVAYCNTACAKTYWHKKHKMECRSSASEL